MPDIQSPPPKYIANATAADTPLAPSSIPQLLLLNAGAHIDYSGINIEPSNFVSAVFVHCRTNGLFRLTGAARSVSDSKSRRISRDVPKLSGSLLV